MLISMGTFGQTVVNSEKSGDWDENGSGGFFGIDPTWNQNAPNNSNNVYDTIVIEQGHTVKLTADVNLRAGRTNPIYLVVKGTLNIGGGGIIFIGGAGYKLLLPSGSAISIRNSGKITGASGSGIFGGSYDDKIYIGNELVYSHKDDRNVYESYLKESGSNTNLPVELLSFDSEIENKTIKLYWQTATETNSDIYKVQRSVDGENWETIGQLMAAGNSNELLDYQFEDNNPLIGDNYYRLLQIDFDGKFEYFGPVYAKMEQSAPEGKFNIYPNPNTNGQLSISFSNKMKAGDVIEIYDYSGRQMQTYRIDSEIKTKQINISEYTKGVYFVRYINEGQIISKKLIIR